MDILNSKLINTGLVMHFRNYLVTVPMCVGGGRVDVGGRGGRGGGLHMHPCPPPPDPPLNYVQ